MKLTFCIATLMLSWGSANAQSCNVSDEVRQSITQFLCGAFDEDQSYRMDGENCVERSFAPRIEDSISHLILLDACGFAEFSDEYESAILGFAETMSKLYDCVGVHVDISPGFEEIRNRLIESRGAPNCNVPLKLELMSKMTEFRAVVDQLTAPDFEAQFIESLGLSLDQNGIISEIEY